MACPPPQHFEFRLLRNNALFDFRFWIGKGKIFCYDGRRIFKTVTGCEACHGEHRTIDETSFANDRRNSVLILPSVSFASSRIVNRMLTLISGVSADGNNMLLSILIRPGTAPLGNTQHCHQQD
jgi:hypothetical protein